jgi:hypothetical protein
VDDPAGDRFLGIRTGRLEVEIDEPLGVVLSRLGGPDLLWIHHLQREVIGPDLPHA